MTDLGLSIEELSSKSRIPIKKLIGIGYSLDVRLHPHELWGLVEALRLPGRLLLNDRDKAVWFHHKALYDDIPLGSELDALARRQYYEWQHRLEGFAQEIWFATPRLSMTLSPPNFHRHVLQGDITSPTLRTANLELRAMYTKRSAFICGKLVAQEITARALFLEEPTRELFRKLPGKIRRKYLDFLKTLLDSQFLKLKVITSREMAKADVDRMSIAITHDHLAGRSGVVFADQLTEAKKVRESKVTLANNKLFADSVEMYLDYWCSSKAKSLSAGDLMALVS